MSAATLREEIVETARDIERLGINQGTSGNVSARWEGGFLITPSGIPPRDLDVRSIVHLPMDIDSTSLSTLSSDQMRPSSEWRFHRDIYQARPEISAIVHTHSTAATAIAIHSRDIPAHHYMVAAAGGNSIRCAPYALFGSKELSDNAVRALGGRTACLLAHHGVIALGHDLARALWLANEVEVLAKQYLLACQLGTPPILTDEQMSAVVEKFKSYGPKRPMPESV